MNMFEKIGITLFVALCGLFAYVIFIIMPVLFYADAKCLRAGYPVAHVTIGLEMYCSNLQGTVTVQVDKLK